MTDRELMQPVQDDGACRHCDGSGCVACDARCLPEQPVQEPVARVIADNSRELAVEALTSKHLRKGTKLYTAPQPRQWQGLTDKEFDEIYTHYLTKAAAMERVEAVLREKNT